MKRVTSYFLAWVLLVNILTAQTFKDSLLDKISRLKTPKEQVDFLNKTSDDFKKSLLSKKAETASLLALEIVKKNNLKEQFSKTITFLGFAYREQSRYSEARDCFKKALDNAIKLKQDIQIAYAYNNLASMERVLANYSLAIDYIYKALEYFEKLNHIKGEGNCYLNLAILFNYLGKYEEALDACKKSEELRSKNNNKVGVSIAYYYFAEIYYKKGDYQKAIEYYNKYFKLRKATKYFSENNYKFYYMGLAGAYYELGNYSRALDYRLKAMKYVKKLGGNDQIVLNLYGIGKIYMKLNKPELAEKNLKEALKVSLQNDYKNRTLDIYKTLSELYETQGKIDSAYNYLSKFTSLNEDIFNNKTKEKINILEAKYKAIEKDWENKLLHSKLSLESKRNYYLLIISILAILALITLGMLFARKRKANRLLKEVVQTKDLFFSIISHDLKNPFGSVMNNSDLLLAEYNELTDDERLFLIENINISSKKILTLLEDLLLWSKTNNQGKHFVTGNINLEEIAFQAVDPLRAIAADKSVSIILDLDKELKVKVEPNSLKTIIRNLTNNAIKYSHNSGEVKIKSFLDGNQIKLSIIDSGIGMSEELVYAIQNNEKIQSTLGTSGEKGTGFGLVICRDLIKQNCGSLEIESKPGKGTKFTIIFDNN